MQGPAGKWTSVAGMRGDWLWNCCEEDDAVDVTGPTRVVQEVSDKGQSV